MTYGHGVGKVHVDRTPRTLVYNFKSPILALGGNRFLACYT